MINIVFAIRRIALFILGSSKTPQVGRLAAGDDPGHRPARAAGFKLTRPRSHVCQAVEAGGGTIRIRNYPGEGCTFSIELPRVPTLHEGAAAYAGSTDPPARPSSTSGSTPSPT